MVDCLGEVLEFVTEPPVFHFSVAYTVLLVELASLDTILSAVVVMLNRAMKRSVFVVTAAVAVVVVDKLESVSRIPAELQQYQEHSVGDF